jgi:hypothetical protein
VVQSADSADVALLFDSVRRCFTGQLENRLNTMSAFSDSTDGGSAASAANQDLVLLIHGTFAGREADQGDSWWQEGSAAWEELRKRLPDGTRLSEQGEVFHWSGDNSERARIKAGTDLLEQMLQLEAGGRKYHLIGHSHGGSVIWHALRQATLRRKVLTGLRSWTTVGTPFLHYRTSGAWSLANVGSLVLAVLLLNPACKAFYGFFMFALAAVLGSHATLDLRSNQQVGPAMAMFRAPIFALLEWVGVPIVATDTGLRLGSYDPQTGQSLFQYLFMSWEGWCICAIVLLGGYVFLLLAAFFLNPVLESLRIRAEKKLEQAAMEAYRGRWLGLWSPNDEAINGLRATLDLSVSFVSQVAPRERILFSDYLSLVSRPYFWILAPIFNSLLRPHLDRMVRSMVVKTAQGNNRPAAWVVAVSPYPVVDSDAETHPALPSELNQCLVDRANHYARDIAPKLRDLLAEPSFVAGLERFGHELNGQELIHTSYFDHAPVLDLLALHVGWSRRGVAPPPDTSQIEDHLWNWFCLFKHSVHETTDADLPSHPSPRPHLIWPRRRKRLDALCESKG